MPEDPNSTAISRRTLLGAVSAPPLICMGASAVVAAATDGLAGLCAQWLFAEFEADELARRWAVLEAQAISAFDYFGMSDRQRRRLPMGPEMAAIEARLDNLWKVQKRHFKAVAKMEPKNVHEAVSVMVVVAKLDARDEGPAGPLIRRTRAFFAKATCPGCGAPYVPASLPKN